MNASKVTSAEEAIGLIADGSTVAIQGSGEGSASQLFCSRRWERDSLQGADPGISHFFTPPAWEIRKRSAAIIWLRRVWSRKTLRVISGWRQRWRK